MAIRMMKAKRVHVVVERSLTEKVPVTVFEHEIPCIEAHHGEGSVTIPDNLPKDILDYQAIGKVVEINPAEEWNRLIAAYGRHPEANISTCEYVFQQNRMNMFNFNLKEYLSMQNGEALDDEFELTEDEPSDPDATGDTGDTGEGDQGTTGGDEIINALRAKLDLMGEKYHHKAGVEKLSEQLASEIKIRLELAEIDFEEDEPLESLWNKLPDEARQASAD